MYLYPARRGPSVDLDGLIDAVRWLFLAARWDNEPYRHWCCHRGRACLSQLAWPEHLLDAYLYHAAHLLFPAAR